MGKVKLVEDENNGKRYAMKVIKRTMIRSGPDNKFGEDVRREIAIMKKLKHDNVLDLIEVIDAKDSDKLYLIVEYYPEGTILSDLSVALGTEPRATPLPENEIRELVRDILKGRHIFLLFLFPVIFHTQLNNFTNYFSHFRIAVCFSSTICYFSVFKVSQSRRIHSHSSAYFIVISTLKA